MAKVTYNESDIKTFENLEVIRKDRDRNLGMSHEELPAQTHVIKEILDNSIDEVRMDSSSHHYVKIKFLQTPKSWRIVIMDDCRGVPIGKLVDSFTKLHTTGKSGDSYISSIGLHGIGSKLAAGLSKEFVAITKRDNKIASIYVKDAKLTHHKVHKDKSQGTGTIIYFEPDKNMLLNPEKYMASQEFTNLLKLIEFFDIFIPNITITVDVIKGKTDVDFTDTKTMWKYFQNLTGDVLYSGSQVTPKEFVCKEFKITKELIWQTDVVKKDLDLFDIEDRVGYQLELLYNKQIDTTKIFGSVNLIPIHDVNSTHIVVLISVIKEILSKFIDSDEIREFFVNKYKLPLAGYIVMYAKDIQFVNQNKTAFKDRKIATIFNRHLTHLLKENKTIQWLELYESIEEHLNDAFKKFFRKNNVADDLRNVNQDLDDIKCYVGCHPNEEAELLITEGHSAGDAVVNNRDPNFQAVFKLQGKPLNLIKKKLSVNNSNDMMKDLMRIIGVHSRDKDLNNMNFKYIGLLTDADAHGYHIAALMVSNLMAIHPLILKERRVFIANPPLYAISHGRKDKIYVRTYSEMLDMRINKLYLPKMQITLSKEGMQPILLNKDKALFKEVAKDIFSASKTIDNEAKHRATLPLVIIWALKALEEIKKQDWNAVAKKLYLDSVTYDKSANNIIFSAGIDFSLPYLGIIETLEQLKNNDAIKRLLVYDFFVTYGNKYADTKIEFTEINDIFNELNKLQKIQHLKGLGEMTGIALEESVINPMTRSQTFIQDIGELQQIYNLLGVDTTSRKQLMSNYI